MIPKEKRDRVFGRGINLPINEIAQDLRVPAQTMKNRVEQLFIDKSPLDKRDVYLLERIKLAGERLLASAQAEKDRILIELNQLDDRGYELGFSSNEIWGMNAAALLVRKEKGDKLAEFIRQVEERLGR